MLKEDKKYHLLLFIISPILGLLHGLKTKNKAYIRWSVFMFVMIYASVLHPSHLGDGASNFENLINNYLYLSFSDFWDGLMAIFAFDPMVYTNDDPYLHFLSYFVGTILNAPELFFLFVGIVYAYFYSGAMVKLLEYVNWNSKYNKFYFSFFLILFLLWHNPGHMQSVRNGTGVWILIYTVISYHQTKKIKYLFLLLLTPLVHIAYLVLAIPFLVVLISNYRNPKIYFTIFMLSVLTTNFVNPDSANEFVSQTEVGRKKATGYTVDEDRAEKIEEQIEERSSDSRFYKTYQQYKIHYNVLTGLIIFMFLFLRNRGFGQIENTLFSYGLAGASFANFFNFNFAVFNRTWGHSSIFILVLLLIFLSKHNLKNILFSFLKVRLPLFIFSLAFVPHILYLTSAFLNFTPVYVLMMPVVMWIEFDMGISIRGLIGLFM
jgi:hypothetical protein